MKRKIVSLICTVTLSTALAVQPVFAVSNVNQAMPESVEESESIDEYSCAATPQIRQTGNRLSGLAETAYASLLAQCFV